MYMLCLLCGVFVWVSRWVPESHANWRYLPFNSSHQFFAGAPLCNWNWHGRRASIVIQHNCRMYMRSLVPLIRNNILWKGWWQPLFVFLSVYAIVLCGNFIRHRLASNACLRRVSQLAMTFRWELADFLRSSLFRNYGRQSFILILAILVFMGAIEWTFPQ